MHLHMHLYMQELYAQKPDPGYIAKKMIAAEAKN